MAAVAAALVVGLVAGFVLASGGVVSPPPENVAALAAEIPLQLQRAAVQLESYQAVFDVTELNWARAVPRRTFVAEVSFRAPESFRVQVRDTTDYPSEVWPRNDESLVTDGHSFRATGPNPCPAAALPACPQPVPVTREVIDRAPFDPRSSAPTDIVVPMTVLAASDRVDVRSAGQVAGHDAVTVQLLYQDAGSLFQYLRFLGSWRPFFPEDRVLLWLDRTTWFPLRYELYPAAGSERELWAAQRGLPPEPPDTPVFTATVRTFSTEAAPPSTFSVPTGTPRADEGFADRPLAEFAASGAVRPAVTGGLSLWRYGSFPMSPSRPFLETVAAYARGLSWLTVTRVQEWRQPSPFGVGPFAELVTLARGVGYYEPASQDEPRRVALHTAAGEFLVLPSELPAGYEPASGQTFRGHGARGVAIAFRRPAAELDGVGLLLYQALGQAMPPPTRGDEQSVQIRGTTARWSPGAHELEWMEHGTYVSLSGPSFGLTELVRVADSLVQGRVGP